MRQKILPIMLVVLMAFAFIPFCAKTVYAGSIVRTGTCGTGVTYTLDEDGLLEISGTGSIDMHAFRTPSFTIKNVVIKPGVTGIGAGAFLWCDAMESIVIPDTVKTIGDDAFGATGRLKTIVIPDSVDQSSIYNCFDLRYINYHPEELAYRTIYTVPGSAADEMLSKYCTIKYLSGKGIKPNDYLGFITDRIVIKPNGTAKLSDYICTSFDLNDCSITIFDPNLFMYDGGMIANLSEGECDLTVSKGNFTDSIRLITSSSVSDTSSIHYLNSEMNVEKGDFIINPLIADPIDATDIAANRGITGDSDVLTPVSYGFKASRAGTASVTAYLGSNREITASFTVNVIAPFMDIVTLGDVYDYRIRTNTSEKIMYYLYPFDTSDELSIQYSSDDPSVVSIDENGIMAANANGTANISISAGGITKTVAVTAYTSLESISIDQESVRAKCGDSVQLNIVGSPQTTTEHATVTWKSDKEAVATVDENGKVTVKGVGIATITATANGRLTATASVISTDHSWNEKYSVDKEPTCAEEGQKSIHCSGCGLVKEGTETAIPIDEKAHVWGEPTYTWSSDNSSVTATRTCKNESSHKDTETVKTTSKAASYTAKGQTTYTAVFTNDAFSTQTKVVANIPQLAKKANTLTVKPRTATVKYSKVKKKTQTVKKAKAMTVSKSQGTVSYKLTGVTKAKFKKYFKVNARTGNITVKKGLKKGTYKVKIKVTAAGTTAYKAGSKTVTTTIKVK